MPRRLHWRERNQRDIDRLRRLCAEYPNLLTDISSLTQVNKPGYLGEVLTAPEFETRLLYGTDFPLINMPWSRRTGIHSACALPRCGPSPPSRIHWDRDVALKQALGVPRAVFAHAATVLPNQRNARRATAASATSPRFDSTRSAPATQ